MANELRPLPVADAVEQYINHRKTKSSAETIDTIETGLGHFSQWAEESEIDNLNEVRGRELQNFKTWLMNSRKDKTITLAGNLFVVRRFLVYAARINAVKSDVPKKTPIPTVLDENKVCTDNLPNEHVKTIRQYLEEMEPASRHYMEFKSILESGLRLGSCRALDEQDVDEG